MHTPSTFEELQNIHDDIHYNTALPGLVHFNNPIWSLLYVIDKTKDRLAKSLVKQPRSFGRFLKNNRGKSLLAGVFFSYMFSPEIGYFKNQGKWIVADQKTKQETGLDSLYHTNDRETNTIIKLVSGIASQSEIDTLATTYGHKQAFDTMYANTPKDTLMYKCISTLFMKLHNPHASFLGSYKRDILGDALGYDKGHVSAKVNEFQANMHIANIKRIGVFADTANLYHTMDSIAIAKGAKLSNDDIAKKLHELNKKGAKYIINKIVAELGHIRGLHRDGIIRYYMNYFGNYIKSGGNQKTLYDKEGTEEYMTHTIDNGWGQGEEGDLIAQFIKLYEEQMPKNNKRHMERLASFYNGFFENYKDPVKSAFYREKVKSMR